MNNEHGTTTLLHGQRRTVVFARDLKVGDFFINRGNVCVIDYICVGTGVSISARQAFTSISANKYGSYDMTVRQIQP